MKKPIIAVLSVQEHFVNIAVGFFKGKELRILFESGASLPSGDIQQENIRNQYTTVFQSLISKANYAFGGTLQKVVVGIDSSYATLTRTRKSMSFNRVQQIKLSDVEEVHKLALEELKLPEGYISLGFTPVAYYLDNKLVYNPRNQNAEILEVVGNVNVAKKKQVYALLYAIEQAGVSVADVLTRSEATISSLMKTTTHNASSGTLTFDFDRSYIYVILSDQNVIIDTLVYGYGVQKLVYDLVEQFHLSKEEAMDILRNGIRLGHSKSIVTELYGQSIEVIRDFILTKLDKVFDIVLTDLKENDIAHLITSISIIGKLDVFKDISVYIADKFGNKFPTNLIKNDTIGLYGYSKHEIRGLFVEHKSKSTASFDRENCAMID